MEGEDKSEERSSLGFYTNTTCLDLVRVEGESSVTAMEECDDPSVSVEESGALDGKHKRQKVNAGSRNDQYAATCSRYSDTSDAYLDTLERGSPKTEQEDVGVYLTDDLLHIVFSFLCHADLCRAAIVCRQWRVASLHKDFWKCLTFQNNNISMKQYELFGYISFKVICNRNPHAIELNFVGAAANYLVVSSAMSSLRNLEVLNLGQAKLGDDFFHALVNCCNLLRSLNITNAILDYGGQEIPINHDKLKQLHLIRCIFKKISIRCPLLETLSLKQSNMRQARVNCPILHDLDLSSCHILSDLEIRSTASSCPLLESLDVSDCSCVNDGTFHEIAQNCVNLHVLRVSYCPSLFLMSVRLPMLTVVKIHNCHGITSASMVSLSYSTMLEVLDLDNCSMLVSVSLHLPRLRHIRVEHCCYLADLNLRALMLSSIIVSNCAILHRVSLTSNSLKKLAQQKLDKLTIVPLQCPSLQEIDLSGCNSLSDSTCEAFFAGGGCPTLKSLVLGNCKSLRAVRLCSKSLISLSLAGCCGITTLEVSCPYLEQLCLGGCLHLERTSFSPVGLQSVNLGICPKLSELIIEAPEMVVLELKGCGVLSKASISCPLLMSLDASFCSKLKDEFLITTAASCPLIESLILMSCSSIGCDGLQSLRWLRRLTFLDLSYTYLINLTPVFESCLQLKHASSLVLEPLYKDVALPTLCELDLSNVSICQSAIEELLACCTHLTRVNLNDCKNMHDLNWSTATANFHFSEPSPGYALECTKVVSSRVVEEEGRLLQILNCVACPNIEKVLIPPPADCFHLSTLNLSLSANLKEVGIACLSLSTLNLSYCCSLEILKLNCPKLTRLFLQSCNIDIETLEAALSQCFMLETLDVRFCPKIHSENTISRLSISCHSLKRIYNSLSCQLFIRRSLQRSYGGNCPV